MNRTDPLVVFMLDAQRYALHLSAVDRVIRMVHLTPLLAAPEIVLGVINVQGQVIPVINLRRRFRLLESAIILSDQLILAHSGRRPVALVVDAVTEVVECSGQGLVEAKSILSAAGYLAGVLKLPDGLILVHDLDTFLSLEEEDSLDRALETA